MKPVSYRTELVSISESDIVELARFVAVQSGREPASVESHLRWFLLGTLRAIPRSPLVADWARCKDVTAVPRTIFLVSWTPHI
jgi:hypothetical protein